MYSNDKEREERVRAGLESNLLAEYQRQANETSVVQEVQEAATGELDEETQQRLLLMEENDKFERYKDIVNVHAAALNASTAEERPYRSLDDMDAESAYEDQLLHEYTMPAHE